MEKKEKISHQDVHFMEPTDNMEISTYCIAMMFTTLHCTIKELVLTLGYLTRLLFAVYVQVQSRCQPRNE